MYNTDYSGFKYDVSDDYLSSTVKIDDVIFEGNELSLPNGYKQLEYIKSTGEQYIDTGINSTSNIGIYCKFLEEQTQSSGGLFGNFGQGGVTYYGFSQWNDIFETFYGTQGNNITRPQCLIYTEYELYFNYLNDKKIILNNTVINDSLSTITDSNHNIWIYRINNGTTGYNYYISSNTRIYKFKITDNDVLVRDYIPCYRKIDNEPGLYDLVENKFYTNKGSGNDFTPGTVINSNNVKSFYKKLDSSTWIENTNEDQSIINISEAGTYSIKVEYNGKIVQYDNIKVNPKQSTANAPELTEDMIPVVWDREKLNWVKADISNTENSWYNYTKGENRWANVAIVSENGTNSRSFYKNAEEGTEILTDDIEAMFVWIPRFKYTVNNNTYNVTFSNGLKDLTTSGSTMPSSFETSKKGIWVGKFECSKPGENIQIKPNQNSVNNITFSNAKTAASGFSTTYNLTGITSSIISDDAWTAVSILSKYATSNSNIYTNSYYEGTGSNTIRTGMAGVGAENTEYNSSTNANFQKTNRIENTGEITLKGFVNGSNVTYNFYEYWTDNGQKASTTQNVYGIYDMVGGYSEYVIYGAGSTAYTRGGTYSENEYKDIVTAAVESGNVAATFRVMLTKSSE